MGVLVIALVCIYPTLARWNKDTTPAWWTSIGLPGPINLGLDLKGGMHLILEVQADKAVESAAERTVEELKFNLRKENVAVSGVTRVDGNRIKVLIARPEDEAAVTKMLERNFEYLVVSGTSPEEDGRLSMTLRFDPKEAERIKELAVSQGLETIRNRVDQFGVSEPDIRPQGRQPDHHPAARGRGPQGSGQAHRPHRPARVQTG